MSNIFVEEKIIQKKTEEEVQEIKEEGEIMELAIPEDEVEEEEKPKEPEI